MNSSNPLVSSIITDARNKADEILSTAAKEAQSIIAEAEEKARKGEEAEERSLAQRLEQIRLRKESARKSIDRLSELRALDSSYSEVMDEVTDFFSIVPYPMTTTSLSTWLSSCRVILMTDCVPISTVCSAYPMYENFSCPAAGALIA